MANEDLNESSHDVSITWRTCHDKMMARGGLFEQLELGLYTEVEHAHG